MLGISPREVTFARRGFHGGRVEARRRLERIGVVFLRGYHAALVWEDLEELIPVLRDVEPEEVGFAFEGAAMGLALTDALAPRGGDRLRAFLEGPGSPHAYMIHVGVGWLLGRIPLRIGPAIERLDPLLRWLAWDGFGFHEGYFRHRSSVGKQAVPGRLSGYPLRAFDQGLGRSLWFVYGADAGRIAETVAAFPRARHADLWSGVGLASAYAGGADRRALAALRVASGEFRDHLVQGTAFAAKARQRAGNPAPQTEDACQVLGALSACQAAAIVDEAMDNLPADGAVPAYEVWRSRIRGRCLAS